MKKYLRDSIQNFGKTPVKLLRTYLTNYFFSTHFGNILCCYCIDVAAVAAVADAVVVTYFCHILPFSFLIAFLTSEHLRNWLEWSK
jgi:hypothetical protein